MAIQQAAYPIIRGVAYDHASAEITVNGTIFIGIDKIDWTETLKPGIVRGTRPEKLARTRGEHDSTGSFSMPLADAQALVDALGDGWMEVSFDVVLNYSNEGASNQNVVLVGCRITEHKAGSSAGSDPAKDEFSVDIMRVENNGKKAVKGMLT